MKKLIVLLTVLLCVANVFGFRSVPLSRMINAVQAYPPGTATGQTLQAAYDYLTDADRDAAMGTLSVLNQRTLVLTAGKYTSTSFVLDTAYVNIVGLGDVTITDTTGAVIDCGTVIATISNIRLDASSIANGLTNDSLTRVSNVTIIDGTDEVIYLTGISGTQVYDVTDLGYSTSPLFIGATPIGFEGATVNDFEVTIAVTDPTADTTWTYPDGATDIFAFMGSTLTTNIAEAANSVWGVSNGVTYEGATADAFETTVSPADPTVDRTITIPDRSGIVAYTNTTFNEFESVGIVSTKTSGGGAATGSNGAENLWLYPEGMFEYHINSAGGQTILQPVIAVGGVNIGLDQADDEGMEMSQGITAQSKHAYVIDTDAFFLKVQFSIQTVVGTDDCAVGFRLAEPYQATVNGYNDYAMLNSILGVLNIETDLNGSDPITTDTTNADWADGETHTFGIFVDITGAVTYTIDGAAPSATAAFTFDTGDVIVPFMYHINDPSFSGAIIVKSWECGLQ